MTWKANKDTALLIVDVQPDFMPGGNLPVAGGDEIIDPIDKLSTHFEFIVETQDWHPAGHSSFASSHPGKNPGDIIDMPYGEQRLWPDHCIQETKGAEIHSDLKIVPDLIIQKGTDPSIDSYSAFLENDKVTPPRFADGSTLKDKLKERGIKNVVFTGLAGDVCVGNSALDALTAGFNAIVAKHLTRSIKIELGNGKTTETEMDKAILAAGGKIVNSDTELQFALGL